MKEFKLVLSITPKVTSQAIESLTKGLNEGERIGLLGITGSGKTFTVASVIEVNRPTPIFTTRRSPRSFTRSSGRSSPKCAEYRKLLLLPPEVHRRNRHVHRERGDDNEEIDRLFATRRSSNVAT
jgi:hypothetical protein